MGSPAPPTTALAGGIITYLLVASCGFLYTIAYQKDYRNAIMSMK